MCTSKTLPRLRGWEELTVGVNLENPGTIRGNLPTGTGTVLELGRGAGSRGDAGSTFHPAGNEVMGSYERA